MRKYFDGYGHFVGTVTDAPAASDTQSDDALWHVQYEDGDEEDLDRGEMARYAYRRQEANERRRYAALWLLRFLQRNAPQLEHFSVRDVILPQVG